MDKTTLIQDEFISTVSHEMRTPLTSIRGFSQTLLASWDRIDDASKKKFIKIIEEQSNRLINLVENILTVSKANAGNIILKKVSVNNSIRNIIPMFVEHYKKHKFTFEPQNKSIFARLDEDKFQQIMTNIIDNAAKYSPEKTEVIITTEILGDTIYIKVKDFGVGIKQEDNDKIFKKFSRIENYLTSKTQGNGLGLYITKQLVESMNGEILFESELNKGTTFIIKFPVFNPEEALKCYQKS